MVPSHQVWALLSNRHTLVLGAWPQRTQKSASRKGLWGFRSLRKLPRVEGFLLSFCNRQICLYIVKQPFHAVVTGVTLSRQCRLPRCCPELESQQEHVSQCVRACDAAVSSCSCPDDSFSFPLAGTFPIHYLSPPPLFLFLLLSSLSKSHYI